jgi:predicted NBD/HSP70 family sugar kinase
VGAFYAGRRQQVRDVRLPPFSEIVLRAEAGDARAHRALQRVGAYLGIGISNVILALGVPDIVVTGPILDGWRFIREPLREAMAKSLPGRLVRWSVEAGEPAGAGIGGAVAVAVAHYLMSLASMRIAA